MKKILLFFSLCIGFLALPNFLNAQCVAIPDGCASPYANVVISEVSGDAGQSDGSNDAIVEIAGPPGTDIGCMVITNTEWAVLIPPGTMIPADGVFALGCLVGSGTGVGIVPSGTNGLEAGGIGDFNAGVPIDFDVCDAGNAAFYDSAASGFTLDNVPGQSPGGDGDQVFLFLPDGTPHDGIYWDSGATGTADHVSASSGMDYTLGDNDGNGTVNDVATTVPGKRGDGGNATAVPILPTDAACPCNTPAMPGTFTVPGIGGASDDNGAGGALWYEFAASDHVGCNSSFIRLDDGTSAGGFGGSPSHTDGEIESAGMDAMGQNLDNGGGATGGATSEVFTSTAFTPTSCGDPSTEWAYTDHPTPGEANDDPTFVFFADQTVLCAPAAVTFMAEVYNYQHVEDMIVSTLQGNNKTGSYVIDETGAQVAWASIAAAGETTTLTYTSGVLPVGTHTFTLVWDDWTDCCGTGGLSTGNECYESEMFTITVAEPFALSSVNVACPGDFEAGLVDISTLVTAGSNLAYDLQYNAVSQEMNTTGLFNIVTDAVDPVTIVVSDPSGCTPPVTVTIDASCKAAPPCPEITGSMMDDVDGVICPGDQVCFDITAFANLPEGGTIDFYTDATNTFDPYAGEGTLLGSADIMGGGTPNWNLTGFTSTGNGSSAYVGGNDGSGSWTNQSAGGGASNTPGIPNDGSATPYSGADIIINEVLYDGPNGCDGGNINGTNAAGEYIEIAGTPGTDIGCYQVSDGDYTIVIPSGTTIPADGIFLIAADQSADADCPPTVSLSEIDLNLGSCNCISQNDFTFTNESGSNGEYVGIFDTSGELVDGVAWGNPDEISGNSPCACTASTNPDDSDITTPGCTVSDIPIPQPNTCSNLKGGVAQFCQTFDASYCNQTANGDFFIKAIINPFTEFDDPTTAGNAGDPNDCFDEDAERFELFMLNMSCPEAELVATGIDVCAADAPAGADLTVNLSGLAAGNYSLVYAIDGVAQPAISVAAPATTATINIPTPTAGEVKVTLVSVFNDADGSTAQEAGECSGTAIGDEVCVNIRPMSAIEITADTDPTTCAPADGTFTITGPADVLFDIDYTGGTLSGVTLPFMVTDLGPGTYTITGATDEGGCPVTINGAAVVLAAPGASVVSATDPAAICDAAGTGMIDLSTLAVLDGAGTDAGALAYYGVDPRVVPGAPALGSSMVDATGTYYIEYNEGGCISYAEVNVTVNPDPMASTTFVAAPCTGNESTPVDVMIDVSGGTAAYMISGLGVVNQVQAADGTATLTPTAITPSTVTIVDANGCMTTVDLSAYTADCLPVELTDFAGKYVAGKVELTWNTSSELNNSHFVVERSLDGTKFSELGKVQGAGTTVEPQAYDFVDGQPKQINYYRLKQVDFDGTYEYSIIIVINTTGDDLGTKVYPVPTSETLVIETERTIDNIKVLDITGRVVLVKEFDTTTRVELNVAKLAAGTYFVSVQAERGVEMIRFVKH